MHQILKSFIALQLFLAVFLSGVCAADSGVNYIHKRDTLFSTARIPFIRNEGQISNPEVGYYAKTFGGTVYVLNSGKIVYALPRFDNGVKNGSAAVVERFGGDFSCEPAGIEPSPAAVNLFLGKEPEKWRTNLPSFNKLDMGEVYEGINLVLAAHGNNVEKIFTVSPGADCRRINFSFEGAREIEITENGQLEVLTALGPVYFSRPVAWLVDEKDDNAQSRAAAGGVPSFPVQTSWPLQAETLHADSAVLLHEEQSTLVDIAYVLEEDGTVGFKTGDYDQSKTLIIDPLLASTFIGGGGADAVQAMVVDTSTNIYVAGYTDSTDFPVTNSPYCSTNCGGNDVFISKFNGDLTALWASTYLGGSSNDQANAIAIDASTRIWVAGYTESSDFPTPGSPKDTSYNGNGDAFVAILPNSLGSLSQATYLGGTEIDSALAITMSRTNQYIAGFTASPDFPVTNGYATTYVGGRDGFVVLFSNSLSSAAFKAGTFLGGIQKDEVKGAIIEPGNTNPVCVVGYTASPDFPITNAYQRTIGGSNDAFITRLSYLLTNLVGSTFLGGTGRDEAYGVGLDLSNRVYVTGLTGSENFPVRPSNTNIYYPGWSNMFKGGLDVFVSCLTNNLTNLFASTYLGGTGNDIGRCIIVAGLTTTNTYVCLGGYTTSSNFPATLNAYDRTYNGGEDGFLLRFDNKLTNLLASTYLGGGGNDEVLAMALGPQTNLIYAGGLTASSDFPSSDTALQNEYGGGASDGFVTKLPSFLLYGTLKWRRSTIRGDGTYEGVYSTPALTLDGSVIVANATNLFAFTGEGVLRWQVALTSAVAAQNVPVEGLGTPAVSTNSHIYMNTKTGRVYSISSSGGIDWMYAGTMFDGWSSVALDGNGNLFCGHYDRIYAIDSSGAGLWTNNVRPDNPSYVAAVVNSSGTVYAANSVDPVWICAFDIAGATNHRWTVTGPMYSSFALNSNGMIYAAASNKLYAFNPNGTTVQTWTADAQIYSSPAIGTNGVIYIGAGDKLYSFNTNGTTRQVWLANGGLKSSPAIGSDGSIIIGSTNGYVYSFNDDGTTNWVFETDDEVSFQSPLMDSEGTVFISDDTSIYAIYGSDMPGESDWPCYRHDSLRTGNQGLNVRSFLRPTGLAVSKGTQTNYVMVVWDPSANAVSYELWRSLTNSTATATRIKRLTQTNYNDSSIEAGRIYYYWVKVKTPVARSTFSSGDGGGVPPYPPEGLTASAGVPTNYVALNWQFSSNATAYYIYRSEDPSTPAYLGSSSTTNYSDYTIPAGIRHYYWVMAGNAEAGTSGLGSSASGGIPSTTPTGLSASQGDYLHAVALSWNSSTGASSYLVYRNPEENAGGAAIIQSTSELSASDPAVIPYRHYYYWVRVTNEFGLSGFSAPASGWGYLAAPEAAYATLGTFTNMIRASWIVGSTDATSHVVFRSETPDSSTAIRYAEVVYTSAADTNYDDTAITRGLSYYYWVAAKNSYGSSLWTGASSAGATPPTTPNDLNASDGAYSNMVKVTWSPAPGAIYYTLYRAETYDSTYAAPVGASMTNYYDDRSAVMGVLYYYWVKAANNCGQSSLSTFNSGWRGLIPPENITASDGTSTSEITIGWSPAPAATSYELWRSTSNNVASASRLANNIEIADYTDRNADPGTVYYYWVKSKRGQYVSAFSVSDYGYRSIGMLDIAASDFVFIPTAYGLLANPLSVSFKVSNLSAIDMVEPNNALRYDFYLSRSPVFGASEIYWFGGTNSTLTLSAGSSSRVVLSWLYRQVIFIPVWAAGNYYVFVYINHCLPSGWQDPNLANNVARRFGDLITVGSATARQPIWNDYDGDGKSDFVVYNKTTGTWLAWLSGSGYAAVTVSRLDAQGSRAVPRDYDGDGRFDPCVNNEACGAWRVCLSASNYQMVLVTGWGRAGQTAVPADYDGDGRVDPAVYQDGSWRIWLSDSGYVEQDAAGWGASGWTAVPADYDGDGKADPAVYYEGNGTWRVWLSGSYYAEAIMANCGGSGWMAVPADYDGDGKVDPAVYEEASGTWCVWASSYVYRPIAFTGCGGRGQMPVMGDYDGDGRVDPTVFWQSMGIWRVWPSASSYVEQVLLAAGGEGYQAIAQ
jgi:fibronectin type 3 domain-containing protein